MAAVVPEAGCAILALEHAAMAETVAVLPGEHHCRHLRLPGAMASYWRHLPTVCQSPETHSTWRS